MGIARGAKCSFSTSIAHKACDVVIDMFQLFLKYVRCSVIIWNNLKLYGNNMDTNNVHDEHIFKYI